MEGRSSFLKKKNQKTFIPLKARRSYSTHPKQQKFSASFFQKRRPCFLLSRMTMENLVTTAWLAENLSAPDLIVLDASFYMPAENIDPAVVFEQGHVPGARFFDIEHIADTDTDLPHMVPSAGRFERLAAALGISNTSRLVFYDQKGIFSAPRGWWMMRLFGHEAVAVLDGGLPKWRSEGRAIEQGPPAVPAQGSFRASLRAGRLRGIGDMLENLATRQSQVLDARAAGRFDGTAPEPRPGLPSGHIPGAKNLPASELLRPDNTFLPAAALRARFAAAGVDGSHPVITSCGTGVSAAILTLGLTLAGHDPGALYDGSWTEWASRPDTPKETS
jgi:thiosulfate/3-mercaptopyruvate sulfurtransferase